MHKQAVYWFIALFAVLIVGFWPSYYSRLFGDLSFGQHFHGVTMSLWCLLLILQAWLMRTGRNSIHKQTGKIAFVLGPLVVIAGYYVALDFIAKIPQPYREGTLAIHWVGLFLSTLFAWLFVMAIYHRKNARLHAGYMISTALVFLVPGLGRAIGQMARTIGFENPPFAAVFAVPAVIGAIMVWKMPGQRKIGSPVATVTILWALSVVLYIILPDFQWWKDFTAWSATLL